MYSSVNYAAIQSSMLYIVHSPNVILFLNEFV